MAITVKKAVLWRKEVDNRPGALASALEPLAQAGADLQVVMAYRYPGTDKGAVKLHPVSGTEADGCSPGCRFGPVIDTGAAG